MPKPLLTYIVFPSVCLDTHTIPSVGYASQITLTHTPRYLPKTFHGLGLGLVRLGLVWLDTHCYPKFHFSASPLHTPCDMSKTYMVWFGLVWLDTHLSWLWASSHPHNTPCFYAQHSTPLFLVRVVSCCKLVISYLHSAPCFLIQSNQWLMSPLDYDGH